MSPDALPVRSPGRFTSLLQIQLWQFCSPGRVRGHRDRGHPGPRPEGAGSDCAGLGGVCGIRPHLLALLACHARASWRRLGTVVARGPSMLLRWAAVFLAAVVAYLVIEYVYLGGSLL